MSHKLKPVDRRHSGRDLGKKMLDGMVEIDSDAYLTFGAKWVQR